MTDAAITSQAAFCSCMDLNINFADAVTVVLFEQPMELNLCK